MVVPTIHVKTLSVYNIHGLMFTIYKTKVIFYLWYIAKNNRKYWHVKLIYYYVKKIKKLNQSTF